MRALIGLDLGTSEVKAVAFSPEGEPLARAAAGVPLLHPQPGWAEQRHADIWRAVRRALRGVGAALDAAGHRPVALGLTGQRAGLLVLDAAQRPCSPLITWLDRRHLEEEGDQDVPATDPRFSRAVLLRLGWLRRHRPDLLRGAGHVLVSPRELVLARLVGRPVADPSAASITGLFDPAAGSWDAAVLAAVGLRPAQCSPLRPADAVVGALGRLTARQVGLPAGLPVVVGAGDGETSSLGLGALRAGLRAVSIGTVGAVRSWSATLPDRSAAWQGLYATAAPLGGWVIGGTVPTAGGAVRWYRDLLGWRGGDSYERLVAEAAALGDQPGDLLFVPHLAGSATPTPLPRARGVFFGLTLAHRRPHLARAVFEGVSYALRAVLEAHDGLLGDRAEEVRLGGGGARSAWWRQVLADVLGREVAGTAAPDASALGAALLAGLGVGEFSSPAEALARSVRVVEVCSPRPSLAERYDQRYRAYRALVEALGPHFAAWAPAAARGGPA